MNKSIWVFCLTLAYRVQSQEAIALKNPSFEGIRGAGIDIPSWYNAGPITQSPPDLQPGFFGCDLPPIHGDSYLGMVVRSTGTWESVGQNLSSPVRIGKNYSFTIWLAHSENYTSPVAGFSSFEPFKFVTPICLRIWGGENDNDRAELLVQTSVIANTDWMPYELIFSPQKGDWTNIILEAYYGEESLVNEELPNGNLLIDHCSAIVQIQK